MTAESSVLAGWLHAHARIFVLTGAGCSTASGIPDYRGADGAWKRPPPVTIQAFIGGAGAYRRYWARSHAGWPGFEAARPNDAHAALAALEASGRCPLLVTQNVDGLHQRAGSRAVIDLHGRLDVVACLDCGERMPRAHLQAMLDAANAQWTPGLARTAPDGDADLPDAAVEAFTALYCPQCCGMLKPDVVFFGENVPRARYQAALDALAAADAMLVVGSSLMVYSGFRFARMASERGLSLAVLNQGRTRADDIATLKLEADIGSTLVAALGLASAA